MAKKEKSEGLIPVDRFNFGGLADSKFSGIKHSLYKMIGWDPHSTPGLLKVAQKLTAETTGTEPTELCKVAVNSSNGAQYWFSSTSGKIWERPTTGTWRLVHTTTPAAGAASCLGAAEYQGYIYWATQSRLHRITVALADDNNWTVDAVEDWATFGVTNASFHPMYETPGLVLYIGDGNQVAQVDAGTFSANALDIKTPLIIKSLGGIGTDLLVGTYVADTVTQTEIIRWNTWSVSFTTSDPIPETGINAFLPGDNVVYVNAGIAGNIYVYNGEKLELYRKVPGDYSPTATGEVHPNSVANVGGNILFGFSNITGNPADQGVYRLGRNSKNYPYILDFPYPISERSGTDFVLTGLDIGAILVVGANIYVAWKRSTTVTITIASPGVVTYTAHGLTDGNAMVFSTTGALPTGLTAGTVYFVRSTGANTLNLYDTSANAITGGATGRIDTSGSQSGVHTAANVGIDKLDFSNKLNGAYFETMVITISREAYANFSKAIVAYFSLPASTDIDMYLDTNHAGLGSALTTIDDVDRNIIETKDEGIEFTTLRLKVKATTSSNSGPEIESAGVFII